MANTAVSYLRVSTGRQGISGLGLEAQREAVQQYASRCGLEISAEFIEVESGKKDNRPELSAALSLARRGGHVLLIAKLDRLARSVAFLSALMESGTDFVAVDMPGANRFVLHIMAAVAEFEREQISARTKAALAAAKARGVRLGRNAEVLAKQRTAEAHQFAKSVEFSQGDIIHRQDLTIRQLADQLNARGVRSREGALWSVGNTSRLIARLRSGLPL